MIDPSSHITIKEGTKNTFQDSKKLLKTRHKVRIRIAAAFRTDKKKQKNKRNNKIIYPSQDPDKWVGILDYSHIYIWFRTCCSEWKGHQRDH